MGKGYLSKMTVMLIGSQKLLLAMRLLICGACYEARRL